MLLHYNSRFKKANETIDSWTVQHDPPTDDRIRSIQLVNVVLPQSWYNFNSNNNRIVFNEASGNHTATITPGNYTATTLATEMQTRLNAASGSALTYTVSFDGTTGLTTISATGPFSLLFSQSSSPYYRLGFTNTDTGSATSHTSTQGYNLAPDNFVYLRVSGVGRSTYCSIDQNLYCTFPLAFSSNGYGISSDNNQYKVELKHNIFATNVLRIELVNELNQNLSPLVDYGFTLKIE